MFLPEKIKVRAVRDFEPKLMSYREKAEVGYFLRIRKLTNKREEIGLKSNLNRGRSEENTKVTGGKGHKQRHSDKSVRQRPWSESLEMSKHYSMEYNKDIYNSEDNEEVKESDLSRQESLMNPKDEVTTLRNKEYTKEEERSDIQNQEEAIKMEELETAVQKLKLITDKDALRKTSRFDDESPESKTVDPYAMVLACKRGDKMETLPPANVG